jgi:type I restriction enzyme R subunit
VTSAWRRHEQLGMSEEEAAFYDALAAGAQDIEADPKLAVIASELVQTLRASSKMRVDWTDHASSQAAIRRTIKRLLRKHEYTPPAPTPNGGNGDAHSLDYAANLLYDQARELYRYWPEVDAGDQLFAEV